MDWLRIWMTIALNTQETQRGGSAWKIYSPDSMTFVSEMRHVAKTAQSDQ